MSIEYGRFFRKQVRIDGIGLHLTHTDAIQTERKIAEPTLL